MRKETAYKGIGSNLGACCVFYLAASLLGRVLPQPYWLLLAGSIGFWVLLPYTELFLQRMTRPIRRAMPKKRERILIASSLAKMKPR